jgi:uncharacterized protein YjeT (DUF2065 family)
MGRLLLAVGSLLRLAVGVGYLIAPDGMARRRLAPDIVGHPDGRMSTRGFGALHAGIAVGTLRAAVRNEGCREVAVLNLVCALGDTAATVLERQARGGWERVVLGSVPVDLLDVAWWMNAQRWS